MALSADYLRWCAVAGQGVVATDASSDGGKKIMLHAPAAPVGKDLAASYKMRVGVWMFAIYAIFYGVFVAINVGRPLLMERTVLLGMNLATVYGFALIVFALIQALIYDRMCRLREEAPSAEDGGAN